MHCHQWPSCSVVAYLIDVCAFDILKFNPADIDALNDEFVDYQILPNDKGC